MEHVSFLSKHEIILRGLEDTNEGGKMKRR